MFGYIYLIRNKLNGKIYIGKRESCFFDKNYYGSGKYITSAVNKYGKDNFEREILEWADSREELCRLEEWYIEKYNSRDREIGYNLTKGGIGGSSSGVDNGAYGKHWYTNGIDMILCFEEDCPEGWVPGYSEKRKLISAQVNKGKKFSDEHCRKISESLKLNPPMGGLGRPTSELQKQRTSEARKGISLTQEQKLRISNTLKEYYRTHDGPLKGKKLTDEHRRKISIAKTEKSHKPISLESRKKIGEKNRQHYQGKVVVNDGLKIFHILPEELDSFLRNGYQRGYLNKNCNIHNKNKKCMNNGIRNIYVSTEDISYYTDLGYTLGGMSRKKE